MNLPALLCQDATAVIPAASRRPLPPGGARPPASPGRRVPYAARVAALPALAPALPHPHGTVRHVPDLVGAVLSASAVAAGVLAVSRGGVWGRLSHRPPGRVRTHAVLPLISWRRRARDPRRFRGSPGAATMAAAPPAVPVVRRVGLGRAVHGGVTGLDGTIGTTAMPGGAIAVTGATPPIGRPPLGEPVPGHARVLMAVLPATVLLAATALVRVAGASERVNGPRSRRAAEGGPAMLRRPLAGPRVPLDRAGSDRPALRIHPE